MGEGLEGHCDCHNSGSTLVVVVGMGAVVYLLNILTLEWEN